MWVAGIALRMGSVPGDADAAPESADKSNNADVGDAHDVKAAAAIAVLAAGPWSQPVRLITCGN